MEQFDALAEKYSDSPKKALTQVRMIDHHFLWSFNLIIIDMLKFLINCLFFSLFRKDAELLLQERIKAEQEHIRKHEEMMTLVSQKNRELEKYAGVNMNIQILQIELQLVFFSSQKYPL